MKYQITFKKGNDTYYVVLEANNDTEAYINTMVRVPTADIVAIEPLTISTDNRYHSKRGKYKGFTGYIDEQATSPTWVTLYSDDPTPYKSCRVRREFLELITKNITIIKRSTI